MKRAPAKVPARANNTPALTLTTLRALDEAVVVEEATGVVEEVTEAAADDGVPVEDNSVEVGIPVVVVKVMAETGYPADWQSELIPNFTMRHRFGGKWGINETHHSTRFARRIGCCS